MPCRAPRRMKMHRAAALSRTAEVWYAYWRWLV
jgi:hypothetical protein